VPTYQYVCTSCEAPLEVVQSFSDPSLTECPVCDGGKLRKVFSAVGVVFKGSGFYRTDNRAGGKAGGEGAGGKAVGEGAGGDAKPAAAKTDSAPAATGESKAAAASASTSTAKPPAKSA
jgi:putative FmdB family regulatory protein